MAVQIQQSNNPSFSLADIAQRRAQIDNQEQALSLRELAIGNQQEQLDRRADQTDDRNAIFERQLDQRIAEFETRSDAEKQKVQGQALSQIIESSDSPESALQKARIIGPKLGISPEEVESIGRLDPRVFTDPRAKAQFQKGISAVVEQDGQQGIATSIIDPNSGTTRVDFAPIPGQLVSKLGETAEQQSARKVGEAEGKNKAKNRSERNSATIESGLAAADSTAAIRRGLELLDTVKTGGLAAANLRAKQLFGLEGADEGELSNLLGKAVLGQLRETFGAAFTEREGARLDRIEANFGRSADANRRLLENALQMAVRSAERGIKAAETEGDLAAADDMRDALEFTLSEQKSDLPEGVTEEDIQFTMEKHGVTREQVLERLGG